MKMKPFLALLAFICVFFSSCTDELNPKNESKPEVPANPVDLGMETLYSLQVDKQIMLSSMIRYNSSDGKYFLDLSLKDAESLDISKESYDEIQRLIAKMND